MDWHPDGNILALPGSRTLGILKLLENDQFDFTSEPEITH